MGRLEDLRSKASGLKQQEQDRKEREAGLIKTYRSDIHPKMVRLYGYLNELVEHLNYVKMEVTTNFPLLTNGRPLQFQQSKYQITVDSADETKEIMLKFVYQLDEPVGYKVEGREKVKTQAEYFDRFRLRYKRKDKLDANHEVLYSIFTVEGPMNAAVSFSGDVEKSAIILQLWNFEKLGSTRHILRGADITRDFMDRFAEYLLRENDAFLKLTISNQARSSLQRRLQEDQKQRQQEMRDAEENARRLEEAEAEKRQLDISSIKGLFSKIRRQ